MLMEKQPFIQSNLKIGKIILKKEEDFMKVILLWSASLLCVSCTVQDGSKIPSCEDIKAKDFKEMCVTKKCLEFYEKLCGKEAIKK